MAIFADNTSSQYALPPAITEPGSIPEPICSTNGNTFTWGDKKCPPPAGFEQIEAPEPYNYEQMSIQEKRDLMLEFFVLLKQIDFIQGEDIRALFVEDYEEYISFFENLPLELDLHNERSLLAQFYALNGITLSENEIKFTSGSLTYTVDVFDKTIDVTVPNETPGSLANFVVFQTQKTSVYPKEDFSDIIFAVGGMVLKGGIEDIPDQLVTSFAYSNLSLDSKGYRLIPKGGKGDLDPQALRSVIFVSFLSDGTVITRKANIPVNFPKD